MQPTNSTAPRTELLRLSIAAAAVISLSLIGTGAAWSQTNTSEEVKSRLEKVEKELQELQTQTISKTADTKTAQEDNPKWAAQEKPSEDLDLSKDDDSKEFWKRQSED